MSNFFEAKMTFNNTSDYVVSIMINENSIKRFLPANVECSLNKKSIYLVYFLDGTHEYFVSDYLDHVWSTGLTSPYSVKKTEADEMIKA